MEQNAELNTSRAIPLDWLMASLFFSQKIVLAVSGHLELYDVTCYNTRRKVCALIPKLSRLGPGTDWD